MKAICIDDEPILLNWLYKTVIASQDIESAEAFTNELEAVEYAKSHAFDVAFLDIELHETDGIAIAESLREINPACGIIFCTGHANHAIQAISRINVDGYLLKPIEPEAVQHEIDRLKIRFAENNWLICVDLTSGINIFDKAGKTIHFRRGKTEDLFAELVRQNGQSLSTRALCERLWDDSSASQYLYAKNENYLTQLLTDLRHTLEEHGAPDVLKKNSDGYALCMPLINVTK